MCICMYVCMYACMHVCMHVCMYVCICIERDRVIINRQTTYTPLCKYMSWYVYLDLSIVWSTRSLMLLGSPRSPVIHGLSNNVVPINHPPTHPPTHSLTHSLIHSLCKGSHSPPLLRGSRETMRAAKGGRMYALTSLGLRLFCVAGVRQCALPRVGCTPWRRAPPLLRGRRGTMCIAKGSDVRPGVPRAPPLLRGRRETMCAAKGSDVRLGVL